MILFTFLIFSGNQMFGQTTTATDTLLCHEWKLVSREENGKKIPVDSEEKRDKMIFTLDHKFQVTESGNVDTGVWVYDPITKHLKITETIDGDTVSLKIVTLSKKELVLELLDTDEGSVKLFLESTVN